MDLRLVCSKSGVKFPRGLAVAYDLRQMPAVLYLGAVSVLIGAFFAVKLGNQAVIRQEARLFAHRLGGLQNVLRCLSFRFLSIAATERKKQKQKQQKHLRGACQFVSISLLHFTFLSLRQGQQP